MKLNCVNLFANFASIVRTHKLKQQCEVFQKDIANGKKTIEQLKETVSVQDQTISSLNQNVNVLGDDLKKQQVEFEHASNRYYKTLTDMESTMSTHKTMIRVCFFVDHVLMR